MAFGASALRFHQQPCGFVRPSSAPCRPFPFAVILGNRRNQAISKIARLQVTLTVMDKVPAAPQREPGNCA